MTNQFRFSAQINYLDAHGRKCTAVVDPMRCLDAAKNYDNQGFRVGSIAYFDYKPRKAKAIAIWYANARKSYYGD